MRVRMIALGLAVLMVVPLAATARDYQAPFDFVAGSLYSLAGFLTQATYRLTKETGRIEVYVSSPNNGQASASGWLGKDFQVHSGETLDGTSFQAPVTVTGHANGGLSCKINGYQANASLSVSTLQTNDGTSWQLGETSLLQTYTCPSGNALSVDADFGGSGTFTFHAGAHYALAVNASVSEMEPDLCFNPPQCVTTATADFYSQSGEAQYVTVSRITIPNQPPVPLAHDQRQWFVDHILNGVRLDGTACDYDGSIVRADLVENGEVEASAVGSGACLHVEGPEQRFLPPVPILTAEPFRICGYDNEGASACDDGMLTFTLLPNGPVAATGPVVDAWYTIGSDHIAYSQAEPLNELRHGEHSAHVIVNRVSSQAVVWVDGQLAYAGPAPPN